MTYIDTWIQSEAALAIAKTLLHSLWEGSLAALVLAASLRLIRTSHRRYAAACATLVVIVAAAIGTFFLMAPSAANRTQPTRVFDAGLALTASVAGDGLTDESPRFVLQRLLPWITPAWLAGVLLFNLRQVTSCVAARRMRRRGTCPAADAWQNRLNVIQSRLQIARPVMLLESSLTLFPLVVGHMRPAILMPLGVLTGLTTEQVELILMHELAHIRRRDYLINMLQTVVEGCMFYNPGVWWVSKTIRIEREHCCDDTVVNATDSAHAYAAALTALEENRSSRAHLAIAATGGHLMKRIRRILHHTEPASSPLLPIFNATLLIVVLAGMLTAWPAAPAEPEPMPVASTVGASASPAIASALPEFTAAVPTHQNPIPGPVQNAPRDSYALWLEEDVAYIIGDEERAAFLNLATDQERDRFVEQFWQRRDATPGTADNEFKEEHYRRVAYANANFKTLLASGFGWKTDRGRTYIQWGPPDELEVHGAGTHVGPDGTIRPFPFQLWLYRYIEGIGADVLIEFDDPQGTDEYPRVADTRRR